MCSASCTWSTPGAAVANGGWPVEKEASAMSYEKKEDLEVLVVPEPERELVPSEPAPTEPERTPEPVPAGHGG